MKQASLSYIPYTVNFLAEQLKQWVSTIYGRTGCLWWGIKYGRNITFRGSPILRRHPSSSITISENCKFNSAEWSNSIGLNRRCMITATRNAKIHIGKDSGFSATIIAAAGEITIGERVLCGGNCTIVDSDRHPITTEARLKNRKALPKPIYIGDDVFIGMNCFILKGSNIGNGSVIAANSVVTGTIPPNVIAGGSPATIIKKIP